MGKRGFQPQPTALKILRGNPGRRPLNEREPQHAVAVPEIPKQLSKLGQEEWERTGPLVEECKLITLADRMTFAAYCEACADFLVATEWLNKHERFVVTDRGAVVSHPMVAQKTKAMQLIGSLGGLFGLNPSSRSSIKVPVQEAASGDALEQTLNDSRAV